LFFPPPLPFPPKGEEATLADLWQEGGRSYPCGSLARRGKKLGIGSNIILGCQRSAREKEGKQISLFVFKKRTTIFKNILRYSSIKKL
jgi:hypothetical protein